jgi:hypothetical protein
MLILGIVGYTRGDGESADPSRNTDHAGIAYGKCVLPGDNVYVELPPWGGGRPHSHGRKLRRVALFMGILED